MADKFIVWTEDRETGTISATLKSSRRAAVMAYNRINDPALKAYGWAVSTEAGPAERRAAGLKPFPALGEKD